MKNGSYGKSPIQVILAQFLTVCKERERRYPTERRIQNGLWGWIKKHGILRAHVKIGARIEKCALTKSSFLQKKGIFDHFGC